MPLNVERGGGGAQLPAVGVSLLHCHIRRTHWPVCVCQSPFLLQSRRTVGKMALGFLREQFPGP